MFQCFHIFCRTYWGGAGLGGKPEEHNPAKPQFHADFEHFRLVSHLTFVKKNVIVHLMCDSIANAMCVCDIKLSTTYHLVCTSDYD